MYLSPTPRWPLVVGRGDGCGCWSRSLGGRRAETRRHVPLGCGGEASGARSLRSRGDCDCDYDGPGGRPKIFPRGTFPGRHPQPPGLPSHVVSPGPWPYGEEMRLSENERVDESVVGILMMSTMTLVSTSLPLRSLRPRRVGLLCCTWTRLGKTNRHALYIKTYINRNWKSELRRGAGRRMDTTRQDTKSYRFTNSSTLLDSEPVRPSVPRLRLCRFKQFELSRTLTVQRAPYSRVGVLSHTTLDGQKSTAQKPKLNNRPKR